MYTRYVTLTFPFIQRVPRGLHLLVMDKPDVDITLCLSVYHGDCISSGYALILYRTLCLSVYHGDCIKIPAVVRQIRRTLPQRVPRGLHHDLMEEARKYRGFASACTTGIASMCRDMELAMRYLCLSVYHGDCIPAKTTRNASANTLPQRVPRGLHRQKCTKRNAMIQ